MVNSKDSNSIFPGVLPPRTPGPLGFNDVVDPSARAYLGKTPGPVGFNDAWDPSLYTKGGNSIGHVILPPCNPIDFSIRTEKPWKSSNKLLPYLAIWENGVANGINFAGQMVTNGFILTVYNDSRNKPTIGCGHLVITTDNLKVGDTITLDKANEILKKDLQDAEKAINDKVNVPLYQYEYDALVSIAFNAGRHGVIKLTEFVNGGEYETIPNRIQQYRTGGGNERRRASEAKLFQLGVYNATH